MAGTKSGDKHLGFSYREDLDKWLDDHHAKVFGPFPTPQGDIIRIQVGDDSLYEFADLPRKGKGKVKKKAKKAKKPQTKRDKKGRFAKGNVPWNKSKGKVSVGKPVSPKTPVTGRAGWKNLSPSYRHRLERAGITKISYDKGISLNKARGHGK